MSTNQPDLVTVHVTQEMIDAGIPRKCSQCPIAIAMRNILSSDTSCEANKVVIKVFSHEWESFTQITLPPVARRFIKRFDKLEPVEPFSFTLPRDAFLPGMLREGV